MKKGMKAEGTVTELEFPNKGIVRMEDGTCITVKNTIPGQKVAFVINKLRKKKGEGRLIEVIEPSPEEGERACIHFGACGGCSYQTLSYERQLVLKERQVRSLLEPVLGESFSEVFLGFEQSPLQFEYRNKMEFSFGDEYKDGPLALGMHRRGSFYDLVTVDQCRIVSGDFRKILSATLAYFREQGTPFYHRMTHVGYLRHLVIRRAARTGEVLVVLVTSSQDSSAGKQGMDPDADKEKLLAGWKDALMDLVRQGLLEGEFAGILHTINDSVADVIQNDRTEILYGHDYFYEELLGLRFRITPFSFFQTNSLGAEVLYNIVRDFILSGDQQALEGKLVYDLYSGTGTIAQVLAPVCRKVVGVEIVEEAVEAARENAKENRLENCEFLAGDVLKVLDEIEEKPDFIVLDPPRDGIHPKAMKKILAYGVNRIVYVSCKPSSLARDLEVMIAEGYRVEKIRCLDNFPGTVHVETVVLMSRVKD